MSGVWASPTIIRHIFLHISNDSLSLANDAFLVWILSSDAVFTLYSVYVILSLLTHPSRHMNIECLYFIAIRWLHQNSFGSSYQLYSDNECSKIYLVSEQLYKILSQDRPFKVAKGHWIPIILYSSGRPYAILNEISIEINSISSYPPPEFDRINK
jgi:hypothetical protein